MSRQIGDASRGCSAAIGRYASPPMRLLRTQYFFTFAVLGTVLPYISVFFRQVGLQPWHIGLAFAVWSAAQILSPVLVAWAADSHVDPRRLVLLCSLGSGGSLAVLAMMQGFWPVMGVWTLYCLASIPLLPLIDGIYFSIQRQAAERHEPAPPPYHRVRVWGTIGYIVPSLFLFFMIKTNVTAAPLTGAALAALAGLQALLLRDPRPHRKPAVSEDCGDVPDLQRASAGLPTAAAARTLLQPDLLLLCIALFLGQMASTAHAAFYPVYLIERVGMPFEWVGLVSQVGVVFEIFFVLGCGWMIRRLGTRGVLVAGFAGTALRFGLISISVEPAVAVATQVMHGMLVVILGVLPQPLLNRHAGDDCRHSMQGMYVMLMGCGKTAGSLAAGAVAAQALQPVFGWGALLCSIAGVLILLGFRDRAPIPKRDPADTPRLEARRLVPSPGTPGEG